MKKYMWTLLFLAAIIISLSNTTAYAQESDEGRIIYVLYDNSSSMAFEEEENHMFHSSWVEADYAMRALFASKKDKDIICIYPMNFDKNEIIEVNDMSDIDKASKVFWGNTPFDSIERVASALENASGELNRKWLLIFTDGVFRDEKKREIQKEELKNQLNSINLGINILYLPIGQEDSDGKIIKFSEGELNNNICQISGSGSIMQLILNGCNAIYGRNVLVPIRKDNAIQYKIDVPIKELMVFMQKEGEEYLFKNNTESSAMNLDIQEKIKKELEDFEKDITSKLSVSKTVHESFQSYSAKTPTYDGEEISLSEFQVNLKTKDIFGEMVQFENIESDQQDSYEFEYTFQMIPERETIALYYKIDLGIEIEVRQDGSDLYSWKIPSEVFEAAKSDRKEEGEMQVQMESGKPQLKEGEYEITIYPTTPDGKYRLSNNAALLSTVSLELNGENCKFGIPVVKQAEYEKPIELKVRASGEGMSEELLLEEKMDVIRRLYPLKLEVKNPVKEFKYSELEVEEEDIDKTDSYFSVMLKEENNGRVTDIRDDLLKKIKISGNVKNKKHKIKFKIIQEGESNEYRVYPYLSDIKDESIYDDAVCSLTAEYETIPDNSNYRLEELQGILTGTMDVNLSLRAEPQELDITINKEPEYTFIDLIKNGVNLEIICGDKMVAKDAPIKIKALEGDESYGLLSGNRLERLVDGLRYFFYNNKPEIIVRKKIIFKKRGALCEGEIEDVLNYIPVPPLIVKMVKMGTCVVTLALLSLLIYRVTNFGLGYKFYPVLVLKDQDGGKGVYRIKVRPIWSIPPRKVKLVIKEYFLFQGDFPELRIEKKRGQNFGIINYTYFQDSNRDITINGERITKNTSVSYDDIIEVVYKSELHYKIYFKKCEEVEG